MTRLGAPIVSRRAATTVAVLAVLATAGSAFAGGAHPLDDLPPGHWYEVPSSRIDAHFPEPAPAGNTGPSAVIGAWGGGAFDSIGERLLVWGGGHGDYGGNEVYAFDVAALAWTRAWGPSEGIDTIPGECSATYPDGQPSSRHTYDGIQFSPDTGMLWASGGFRFCGNTGSDQRTWLFDPAAPGGGWIGGADALEGHGTPTSAYDPTSGWIYYQGANDLQAYDPSTDVYTWVATVDGGWWMSATSVIDPVDDLMISVGDDIVRVWDLDTMTVTLEQPTTGGEILVGAGPAGLQWDPLLQRPVLWVGGTSVYSLDVATWEWFEHVAADDNAVTPTAPNGTGTYGRFRYMPSRNAYILVNATDENVFFYKATEGGGTPVPPPPGGDESGDGGGTGEDTGPAPTTGASADATSGGDEGSRPSDGSGATTSAGESGDTAAAESDGDDDGCGCRHGTTPPSSLVWWWVGALAWVGRRRR